VTNIENKIDLAAEITKFGTDCYQDFEGFTSVEEQELVLNEIKKCAKIFEYKEKPGLIQILCDVVLIKIIGEMNEGDISVTDAVDKILDYMVIYNDILSCRYLLKSGINWNKGD
jgi:hypothetical protein